MWSCLSNNSVSEILSVVGYDWIVIDMEHSPNDIQEVLTQLQIVQGYKTEPIVRVPWNDSVIVKRVLDMGAQTILFPYIENAEEALHAVRSTRYPPNGIRGVMSSARMNRYGTVVDYYNTAEKEMCVIVQCETEQSISKIPEIARIVGVDGIFIGPSDLSASINKIGHFESQEVQLLINKSLELCKTSNMPIGILTSNKVYAKKYIRDGFTFVGVNSDANLLARSAESLLQDIRQDINNK